MTEPTRDTLIRIILHAANVGAKDAIRELQEMGEEPRPSLWKRARWWLDNKICDFWDWWYNDS